MSNTATIKISIDVDGKTGVATIRQVGQESKKAGETGEKAFKSSAKSLGDFNAVAARTKLLVGGLAVAFAGLSTAAVLAIRKSIDAASDLQEVVGKFNVVFGRQTTLASKWADQLVDAYAMSTREAKQYLASVQDLLVPMGVQAETAAALSNEIVKLSADLGSFNNLQTAQVMADIQSALVGNYETMKKYGVVLNAANVEQYALTAGMARSKDALTSAHKAQAAYELIVKSSQAAIGDMARTSDGYANQLKKLQAQQEDLSAMLGNKFLPVATEIVTKTNEWIKANSGLIDQKMDQYINATATALKSVKSVYDALPEGMMTGAGGGLVGWILFGKAGGAKLALALYGINAGMSQLGSGLGDLVSSYRESAVAVEEFWQALMGNRKGYAADIRNMQGAAALSLKQQDIPPLDYITITPLGGGGGGSAAKTNPTELGAAGVERAMIAQMEYSRALVDSIRLQNALAAAIQDTYDIDRGSATITQELAEMDAEFQSLEESAKKTANVLEDAFTGWAASYSRTLNDMLWESNLTFEGILESFGRMLSQMVIQKGMSAAGGYLSGLLPSYHGNVFAGPGIGAYENQIVTRPTFFAFARGGVMGEGGRPEAVMPLTRTPSGDLGVKAQAGPGKIDVRLVNQSGTELKASRAEASFDAGSMILQIVLDGVAHNKMGARDMFAGLRS